MSDRWQALKALADRWLQRYDVRRGRDANSIRGRLAGLVGGGLLWVAAVGLAVYVGYALVEKDGDGATLAATVFVAVFAAIGLRAQLAASARPTATLDRRWHGAGHPGALLDVPHTECTLINGGFGPMVIRDIAYAIDREPPSDGSERQPPSRPSSTLDHAGCLAELARAGLAAERDFILMNLSVGSTLRVGEALPISAFAHDVWKEIGSVTCWITYAGYSGPVHRTRIWHRLPAHLDGTLASAEEDGAYPEPGGGPDDTEPAQAESGTSLAGENS